MPRTGSLDTTDQFHFAISASAAEIVLGYCCEARNSAAGSGAHAYAMGLGQ